MRKLAHSQRGRTSFIGSYSVKQEHGAIFHEPLILQGLADTSGLPSEWVDWLYGTVPNSDPTSWPENLFQSRRVNSHKQPSKDGTLVTLARNLE